MNIQHNVDLTALNTFGVPARAALYARFSTVAELRELLVDPTILAAPRLVIGGGSNLLFTRDWPGAVLVNDISGISVVEETAEHVLVRAGAGERWHQLVMWCVERGYAGIENMSLIPGKVGAAPMQNIGAYGVELKDVFHSLEALRIADGVVVPFSKAECRFGYRESFFKREGKDQYIITSVTLRLTQQAHVNISYGSIKGELDKRGITTPSIKDVSDAVIHIRSSKLPDFKVLGNAGSFFKNPVVPEALAERLKATLPDLVTYPAEPGHVKLAAGQLIEKAGWKGFREALPGHPEGGFGVHRDQALVLVNHGGATGANILDLSQRILDSIRDRFGVELEREVNII